MFRCPLLALLFCLAAAAATSARAQALTWETCQGAVGADGPVLRDCRPLQGAIDPQGREIWIRAIVRGPAPSGPRALYIGAVASSEVWLNGARVGANGRPAGSADREIPGRYQIAFPLPDTALRAGDNVLVIHMSSFHGGLRFAAPIAGLVIAPYPFASNAGLMAVTFAAAGALLAAAFGFGVIHVLRRTSSSLILAAMASVAGVQAVVENLRNLISYVYPFHAWRMSAIWLLSAAFAVLLTAYVASRFAPRARRPLTILAGLAVAGAGLAPGFDIKTALALLAGVLLAGVAAVVGVRAKLPGARPVLAYLAFFLVLATAFPEWLADLSFFLLAAGLVLPLLATEVIRLGREDRGREAALVSAASRPDRLTVASARGVELIPIASILAVVGADDYVELRLAGGRRLLHADRLDRLGEALPSTFLRVHRSVIASLAHVSRLERDGDRWRLCLDDDSTLPVSRSRLAAVREALDGKALG